MPLDAIVPLGSGDKSNSKDGPHYDEDMNILDNEDSNDTNDEADDGSDTDDESEGTKKATKSRKTKDGDRDEEDKEIADDKEDEDGEEKDDEYEEVKDKEDKEDKEEEDEEKEMVQLHHNRPTIKEIKVKYPDFFKDFPDLKESYFRELEFSKLFPTIEEAKEAFQDNEAFNNLSDAALNGNPTPLLESINKTDKKAMEVFSLSFLPALYKQSPELYYSAVTPLFEGMLRQAYKEGDENMKNSASNIAQFLFGKDGEDSVLGKKTLSKSTDVTAEQKKLNDQKDQQISEAFRKTYTHVESEIDKSLTFLISKELDPSKQLTKLLRNNLSNEIIKRIKKQLESDSSHGAVMGARWKRAKLNGYTDDDKSKIISTFLARAKSLIPVTSEKVRLAALGKNVRKEPTVHPKEMNGGRVSSSRAPEKKVDYSKMSDLEILNS